MIKAPFFYRSKYEPLVDLSQSLSNDPHSVKQEEKTASWHYKIWIVSLSLALSN